MNPDLRHPDRAPSLPAFLAFALLPAFLPWGPAWLRMGAAGLALLAATKAWITRNHLRAGGGFAPGAAWRWAVWPGMDPKPFAVKADGCGFDVRTLDPAGAAIGLAVLLALGILPRLADAAPEIRGWTGMGILVLAFHFGGFGLMAARLRGRGHPVEPMMGPVLAASTLTGFWGRLWNRPFRDAANRLVFRPMARRWGVPAATVLTFLVSGLIHEAVITVPARAAYGGPTAYFLLQAAGLLWERREHPATGRLDRFTRRIRTWIVLLLPLPWLFPRPFAAEVLAPAIDLLPTLPVPTEMTPNLLLEFGGILQLLMLVAGATMTRVARMGEHAATLPPFLRRLFWTYLGFIGLTITGLGLVSLTLAGRLLDGSPLSRAVCGFTAVFWLARLAVQAFVFDVRPYLTSALLRLGHLLLNIAFTLLPGIYLWAALQETTP